MSVFQSGMHQQLLPGAGHRPVGMHRRQPLPLRLPHQGGRKHVRVRWSGHGRPSDDEGRDQQGDDARASSSP